VAALRERLWQGIGTVGGVRLNGHPQQRIAGVLNVAFSDVEGESLQFSLRDLAVSAGAACSSESEEPSYVLRALGLSDAEARSSLRFSLGRFSTEADVDFAIGCVRREVPRLRGLAPGAPAPAS
jgi:cysteine desulfurase